MVQLLWYVGENKNVTNIFFTTQYNITASNVYDHSYPKRHALK